MSESRTTTEDVKHGYDRFLIEFRDDYSGEKQFDRWLAERDAEVVEAERERIVKLLNNIPPGSGPFGDDIELAIELIKGEN